jgi:hypothetical protein
MVSMDHLAELRKRIEMVRNLERKQEYGFFSRSTQNPSCVSDPDPYSIRSWIRIRIQEGKNDPQN